MASNHGVVYLGPGKVEIQSIDYPELKTPQGRKIDHGVIIKPITTNICGSDQHMVRGRTTAPPGLVLGHEITGEVIECGSGVEFISKGDLVSVPFNVACGRCRNCKERRTDVCLNVNPSRAGGAYGYVDLGGWVGGQAEYVMVPYADWNLLKFPDKDQALAKIRDLTCLSDILPTGYHGCVSAGVTTGSTVLISGAGPGWTCGCIRGIPARRGGGDRRGFQSGTARARPFVRLRNNRPLERRLNHRTAGANPAGSGSGLCR